MFKLGEYVDVTSDIINGFHIIKVKVGEFSGVTYTYGEVKFNESDENCNLIFEYTILSGSIKDEKSFKNFSGDILVQIIENMLSKDEGITYVNGK